MLFSCRKASMYQCDDYQTYIMTCINLMENGHHNDISATITKFLKKYVFRHSTPYMYVHCECNTHGLDMLFIPLQQWFPCHVWWRQQLECVPHAWSCVCWNVQDFHTISPESPEKSLHWTPRAVHLQHNDVGYVFICVYIIIVYLHTHSRIGFVVNNFYLYTCSVLSSEGQISEGASDKEYKSDLARLLDQQMSSADNEWGSNWWSEAWPEVWEGN